MTRSSRVLDFYASKAWAIPEANLQEMYEIYKTALERKELGGYLDPEAVAARTGKPLDNTRTVINRNGVAVIPITGPIFRYANLFTEISGATSVDVLAKDFQSALDDRQVRSIVLDINSPGGEADGTAELAQHIFAARGQKPVVAYVSHLGASAAYWLASAADEIVANDAASLGSIGVVASVCIHKDKNHLEFVSSQSPNKRPNPQTESGRSQIQEWLDSLGEVFINTVARNRDMTAEDIIEQGGRGGLRVGAKAVKAGLADRLGTLEGVISELSTMDMATWKPKRKNVKADSVLDTSAQSDKGDLDMADEKKPADVKDEPKADAADLEKKIDAGIVGFFKKLTGSSAPEPPAPTKIAVDASEAKAEVAALRAESEAARKESAELKTQMAALQKQARETRFSALAKDWPGETPKHVAMLELLATTVEGGEESEPFTSYVSQQKAIAEQIKSATLFTEVGNSAPVEGSISAKVEADIKALTDTDPKLTYEQAYDRVRMGLSAALRKEFDSEQRRTAN